MNGLVSICFCLSLSSAVLAQLPSRTAVDGLWDQVNPAVVIDPSLEDTYPNLVIGVYQDLRRSAVWEFEHPEPGFVLSWDEGKTWSAHLFYPNITVAAERPRARDLDVCMDRYGVVYSAFVREGRYQGNPSLGLFLARSNVDIWQWDLMPITTVVGHNWLTPDIVCDNFQVSPYQDRLYLTWTEIYNVPSGVRHEIHFQYSTNAGDDWVGHRVLATSTTAPPPPYVQPDVLSYYSEAVPPHEVYGVCFSRVAVDPQGTVYVLWRNTRQFGWRGADLVLAKSTNGGASFLAEPYTVVATTSENMWPSSHGALVAFCSPSVAAAPGGEVVVAVMDFAGKFDATRVFRVFRSANYGASWTELDRGGLPWGYDFFWPSVSISGSGRLNVSTFRINQSTQVGEPYLHFSESIGGAFARSARLRSESIYEGDPYRLWQKQIGSTCGGQSSQWIALWGVEGEAATELEGSVTITVSKSVVNQWNLAGVPVYPGNAHKDVVYPSPPRTGGPSDFQNNPVDSLQNDRGYWVKFVGPTLIQYYGERVTSQGMPVVDGWNLIGSISATLSTTDPLAVSPQALIRSPFYRYDNGYWAVTELVPGGGYLVKTYSGTLTLASEGGSVQSLASGDTEALPDELEVFDAADGHQVLTVARGQPSLEMPPPPIDGFYVRFADGNIQKGITEEWGVVPISVELKHVVYPVTVRWRFSSQSGMTYWLRSGTRRRPLPDSGSITLFRESERILGFEAEVLGFPKQRDPSLPEAFDNHPAHPNPFNPLTRIRFDLPEPSTVSLAVFDLLGRKVADLVEGEYEAGYHSASWNATGVASGVYLARFTATSGTGNVVYTKTHKLVLMK